eukprot:Mrub_08961.p1 GENE.Mrub_08961~~Mrub_08961.p1  ORF type:complete len:222 (-),score=36.49 Mrub_08961:125-718(-)
MIESLVKPIQTVKHDRDFNLELKSQLYSKNVKDWTKKPALTKYIPPSTAKFNIKSKTSQFIKLKDDAVRTELKTPQPMMNDNKLPENPGGNKNFGKTPKYLSKKIAEMKRVQSARDIARHEAEICPIGYKLMPEVEKIAMHKQLADSLKEVEKALATAPIGSDTMRHKNYIKNLEEKHKELEVLVQKFSQKFVFVKA